MEDRELEKLRKKKLEELRKRITYPDKPVHLDSTNFDKTIRDYDLVVVDFWAEWCGPCQIIAPIVERLAKKYKGKVVFGKLNVDENREIAMRFGIMGIPTLIVFKNGKPVDKIVGAVPEEYIEASITKFLS